MSTVDARRLRGVLGGTAAVAASFTAWSASSICGSVAGDIGEGGSEEEVYSREVEDEEADSCFVMEVAIVGRVWTADIVVGSIGMGSFGWEVCDSSQQTCCSLFGVQCIAAVAKARVGHGEL